MMLRQKAVVTSLLVALPATAILAVVVERVRANDRELAVRRMVESQINDQVKERCESDPTWFLTGPLVGRPPGGVFVETLDNPLPPRPRVEPQPFELFAYDDQLAGSSSATPRLDPDIRQRLRFTRETVVTPHMTEAGTGVQVAMATGWTGGPCAYLVGRMDAPPNQLRQRILTAIGIFAVCFVAALAALVPIVRRVRRLARDARDAAGNGYAAIAPDQQADELSSVTFVLNDASQELREQRTRVADLDDALRRLVRTTGEDIVEPIAMLERRLAQASRSSISQDDLRGVLTDVHRVSSDLENLAAASRLRLTGPSPEKRTIDLTAIVSRVVERHQAIANANGVTLHTKIPTDAVVGTGDEGLIERAVANLVDNAVRFGGRGSDVTVGLKTEDGGTRFRLWVTDTGPGVSDEHFRGLTAIRRFRGDEGRNRRPGAPGLGLAVAQEVCDRFGLRFELKRPGAGGLEAEVSGPL